MFEHIQGRQLGFVLNKTYDRFHRYAQFLHSRFSNLGRLAHIVLGETSVVICQHFVHFAKLVTLLILLALHFTMQFVTVCLYLTNVRCNAIQMLYVAETAGRFWQLGLFKIV